MVSSGLSLQFSLISKVRSRDEVLKYLLPKYFGIICEQGLRLEGDFSCAARLDGELTLTGCHLGPNRIVLSAYWPLKSQLKKVFSAHVIDSPDWGDPNFYHFLNGHVGLMSWRRGTWEDAVMTHAAPALSIAEAFQRGIFWTEIQLLQ